MAVASVTREFPFEHLTSSGPGALRDCCRVCMAGSTTMRPIFDGPDSTVAEQVLYCTGVLFTKDDSLPSLICSSCHQDLSVAHRFKSNCLRSDVAFQTILAQDLCVKNEPEYLDYDNNQFDAIDNYNDVKQDDLIGELNVKPKRRKLKTKKVKKGPGKYVNKIKKELKSEASSPIPKYKFKKLYCESCDVQFQTRTESEQHKKAFHNEVRMFICEFCGRSFKHASTHISHVRSHLPQKYKCEHCSYMSSTKHDLIKHLRIHTGVKPYQCECCPTSYHTLSNLKDHIRRKHRPPVRRFQCPLCDKRFIDRTKLNRHVDSHNDVKRHICPVCQSRFTRRCYWKKHLEQKHSILVPKMRPGRRRLMDKELASIDDKYYAQMFTGTAGAVNG